MRRRFDAASCFLTIHAKPSPPEKVSESGLIYFDLL